MGWGAGLHVRAGHSLPGRERPVHAAVRAAGHGLVQRHLPQRTAVCAQLQPGSRRISRPEQPVRCDSTLTPQMYSHL